MTGHWVPRDTRDEVVDFVREWAAVTELPARHFVAWLGLHRSKYASWKRRYGRANEHNAWQPRDHWLQPWEREAIVKFAQDHPLEGYRRLTFMMLDRDVVAVSPSSVYRVLRDAGLLQGWRPKTSTKGKGFHQPVQPHEHWHIDIAYLNIAGTFYYLCTVLDGCSRAVVHREIREAMTEQDVEIILQRAREAFPDARPRIISDNGPQFIAKDFKVFIRLAGMTHVRTAPYHPQSNGKIERWHRTLKALAIRPGTPLTLAQARRVVGDFVAYYNGERLHSAIGYVTPDDRLAGRHLAIFEDRRRKLEQARKQRAEARLQSN